MAYKKREINLPPEEDLEFRRIEGIAGEVIIKKIWIGGGGSTTHVGNQIYFEKIASGGETQTKLPTSYAPNSTLLFLNGQLQKRGVFYEETNPASGIITHDALVENDWIFVIYLK